MCVHLPARVLLAATELSLNQAPRVQTVQICTRAGESDSARLRSSLMRALDVRASASARSACCNRTFAESSASRANRSDLYTRWRIGLCSFAFIVDASIGCACICQRAFCLLQQNFR